MKKPYYILCVDDEKAILDTLLRQLNLALGPDVAVEIAESAEEAWELIDEYSDEYTLAVVISDWLMPVTRGDKFLVELHKRYPHVTKIMLSGQADPKAVENAQRNGGLTAFMPKPWDKASLVNLVASSGGGGGGGGRRAAGGGAPAG